MAITLIVTQSKNKNDNKKNKAMKMIMYNRTCDLLITDTLAAEVTVLITTAMNVE